MSSFHMDFLTKNIGEYAQLDLQFDTTSIARKLTKLKDENFSKCQK